MAQIRELIFQLHFPIIISRCIKNRRPFPSRRSECSFQLWNARRRFPNRFCLMSDVVFLEPFNSISAGAAFLVNVDRDHGSNLARLASRCKAGCPPMKSELLAIIRAELRAQLERLSKAALEAHAAATDPGSKAEGKYDTRSLEASYLAAGQARQVDELAESVRIFESLDLPDFKMEDAIDAGALVGANLAGETTYFLLAPTSGGLEITHQGREITLLTPASELYRNLLGMRVGQSLNSPALVVKTVL